MLVVGVLARRPFGAGSLARLGAVAVVPLALTLGVWYVVASAGDRPATNLTGTAAPAAASGSSLRELVSYLWQYYLPRTPLQTEYRIPPGGYPLLQVWITQGWAAFGWLEVKFAPWVYRVLALMTAGAGIAAAVARAAGPPDARPARGRLPRARRSSALLAGLHWTDYHQLEAGMLGFMQARYLFPVIGILGLALAAAVSLVRASWRGSVVGATVAFLLVFHLLSLGLVLERFYA